MFWSARTAFLAVAPSPSPSPSPPESGRELEDAQTSMSNAAEWVDENWQEWLAAGLRIAFILVVALVLRFVVRRMITRLIARMARGAVTGPGRALDGLLVNAERRRQRSEAIGSVLRSMASFIILGTAALTVLSVLRIDLAPLLASAGVAGVAIGFGARNLVTDFLSGVFMILEDQYGVGDVIDAGVATGTVIEVGLRVTKLRGDDGEIWYVRNGEVKRIGNMSQGWATALIDIQVGYQEDLDRVRKVILTAAERMGSEEPWNETLWEPVQVLGLESVTGDMMVVQVQARTMPGKALAAARELRWRIKRAFDEAGIRIVGTVVAPAQDQSPVSDPSSAVAPPSALGNPMSPQSLAASPLPGAQQGPGSPGQQK
ncbi:mechanosensitive ion channel protein MscS [Wenjunlia vitaminophila]|uniref:Mechanosensitive ion channel protein MscS n=1 Tax=Wenjunlia vitaminophila TaxID=76728 RepID=A0A0T6LQ13_WENVI|nr:mechanosensitive ion channel family protein [Wenjunlia vitaminophila]KRV47900.1 mechanosensitive ion channel protein MscS [Wenjunlia vitaminophila]